MTRTLPFLALIVSLIASGWATQRLVDAAKRSAHALPVIHVGDPAIRTGETGRISPPFLAIYGTPQESSSPTPASAPAPEPFAYALKGLIAVGEARWAVLSRDGADIVVREGEVLDGGARIEKVNADGIDIMTEHGPMVLSFSADAPVALREIPSGSDVADAAGPKGNFTAGTPAAVLFQDMTPSEIFAALEEAEKRRVARGWITVSE